MLVQDWLNPALVTLTVVPIGLVATALYVFRSRSHHAKAAQNAYQLTLGLKLLLGQCLVPALQLPQALHHVNDPWPAGISYGLLITWAYLMLATSLGLSVCSSWLLIRAGKLALPILGFVDLLLSLILFLSNFAPTP